jgi:type VI secretion system protein ImpJ
MKPPQKLVWSEGMLMSPHHMQQTDRYHEDLLEARLRAVVPDDWGVIRCELDKRGLETNSIRLHDFAGVLPDGTYLIFDHDDPETPAARPIEGHFGPTKPCLEVFLGVPREREGSANYTEASPTQQQKGRTRYLTAKRPIWDAVTGATETQLSFAQRQVVVLFGDEPREDYEVMKIAEIVRDRNGALVVCDPFVPACLRIGASPFVMEGVKRVLALSVTKQRTLSEARRQRDDASVEFTGADVTRFLLLNAVNTFIPVLAHYAQHGDVPPRAVYLGLCQFAGALSTFSPDADPSTLPAYTYTDLRATFEPLLARITALLNQTVRENYIAVKLDARQDGLHLGKLDDERLARSTTFILVASSTKLGEAQMAEQLPKLSKVASWTEIASLVQAASPGVPVAVTHRLPAEIPVRAGLVYFTLASGDRYWKNVMSERNIAVYLPPPFLHNETTLQVFAVPPPAAGKAGSR